MPGSVLMGDFLDDTSLSLLSMKVVKAFLDVGLYESMCWARWGATKWVQNEPRAAADNTYDPDVPLPPSFVPQISFENFFNMIRPSFTEQASKAHMDADLLFLSIPRSIYTSARLASIRTLWVVWPCHWQST